MQMEGMAKVVVEFDKFHPIFAAHMPGMPICPGAILVQMAQDLLGIKVVQVKNVKFLQLLDPVLTSRVVFCFNAKSESQYQVEVLNNANSDGPIFRFAKMTLCV